MQKIKIPGMTLNGQNNELCYYTSDEVLNGENFHSLYRDILIKICGILQIAVPHFAFGQVAISQDPETGECSIKHAITWTPDDVPGLDRPIIYLGDIDLDGSSVKNLPLLVGLMAHEARHIWQQTYYPDDYNERAKGYLDSLFNPAEIDADAFGIAFITVDKTLDYYGGILCPQEKFECPEAYQLRLVRAAEIKENLYKQPSLFEKFFKHFKRKKA